MKKKTNGLVMAGLAAMITAAGLLTGCNDVTMAGNKQTFDLTYSYEKAIISLPDGTIVEGAVETWTDYEDGDQIQVKIDGKHYLVHSENIVLISE